VTSSNLCLVTYSGVTRDGDNSYKGVGSAGTAWKFVELLGIQHFVHSSAVRGP
jgi:hypothetical protein